MVCFEMNILVNCKTVQFIWNKNVDQGSYEIFRKFPEGYVVEISIVTRCVNFFWQAN